MPRPIPRDESFDATLALIRDPYGFVRKRCQRYGSDLFETRLLLRRTICMTGPEATRLFYDPDRFVRRGVMPERIRSTLLGRGGVQGLDGEAHRHRKRMFMSLMSPERIAELGELTAGILRVHAPKWASRERVVLYDELPEVLTRAVCAWSGVPLAEAEVGRRSRELTAMFDGAGAIGPRHWRSRLARRRGERWIAELVQRVRAGRLDPPEGSALRVIALHRDLEGKPLDPRVSAVEVINVLRPTVAVSVFITLAAHALHRHPEGRRRLRAGEAGYADLFVQEVRRFYPFFPAVMARTRRDFEWKGYRFPEGARVMLDLHGTDHDPRSWDAPEEFRPERFRTWDGNPFDFIPQGGGDHHQGHRCAGEWITIELMKVVVDFLARRIAYDVPEQDLRIDYSRLPALPRSRFVISNVRTDL
ncbi:cytochrome P450 [Roseomonas mucosa]|uniref:cytochrome P450 n=1 Tax=Roseomonas mucosa TaxID=207340 RepID=UPI00224629CA|nr:cytochrome P450 [Roseomonas mucosa]UZO94617.1 Fatty acid beta-hydroxylase [Roseomonas mucosa]